MIKRPTEFCKKMIEKYPDGQVIVAIEELSELQKELTKHLRGKGDRCYIAEEMADVLIVVEQMRELFDITDLELQHIIDFKTNRTEQLLKEEARYND